MVRSDSQRAQFAHDSESLVWCETEVVRLIRALGVFEALERADGKGSHEAIIVLRRLRGPATHGPTGSIELHRSHRNHAYCGSPAPLTASVQ